MFIFACVTLGIGLSLILAALMRARHSADQP